MENIDLPIGNTFRFHENNYRVVESTGITNCFGCAFHNDIDTPFFLSLLRKTVFEVGMYNEATDYIGEKMKINEENTIKWLNSIFNQAIEEDDIEIATKILYIYSDYSLEELGSDASLKVIVALNNNNPLVQLAALELVGHWMNRKFLAKLKKDFQFSSTSAIVMKMKDLIIR